MAVLFHQVRVVAVGHSLSRVFPRTLWNLAGGVDVVCRPLEGDPPALHIVPRGYERLLVLPVDGSEALGRSARFAES
ncbi:MAG: hypothetical protein VXW31_01430, partial [Planctomycetota bacterium]|nr:hypothetical protein [Planctomycetota bacterium]